jgi:hypothetical protein
MDLGDIIEVRVTVLNDTVIREDWLGAVIIGTRRNKVLVQMLKSKEQKWLPVDQRGHMWR